MHGISPRADIGRGDWVVPIDSPEAELIVGRVISIHSNGDVRICWMSSERGLWKNDEALADVVRCAVPTLGYVEALLDIAQPNTPWNYDA